MSTETMVHKKVQLKAVEKVETAAVVKACAMNRKAAPSSWVGEMVARRRYMKATLSTERKLVALTTSEEREPQLRMVCESLDHEGGTPFAQM